MSKFIFLKSLRELLTPLKRLLDKKAENVNWNENDPSSKGYIAGRTHWKESGFSEYTLNITNDFTSYDIPLPTFTEGKTYKILWDGVEYNCTAYIASVAGTPCIGNDVLAMGAGNTGGNGEPFGMLIFKGMNIIGADVAGTHTVGLASTIIHKIPSEYLPEISSVGKEDTGSYSEIFNDYEDNIASGAYSHAEGTRTSAIEYAAHAEGVATTAGGERSHAEGYASEANGWVSHAEGYHTQANNDVSHSEGYYTLASSSCQHVQGQYNIEDSSDKYAHIVGNGSYSERKNAHTLDWNGLGWFAGGLKVGGASQDDESAVNVATINDFLLAKNSIAFIDQVNGYTYIACMRDGNFVTYCGVKSIKVTTMPSKTEYMVGDYLDPTGMVVTATCYDGTTKEITNFNYSSKPMVEGDTFTEITYKEAGIAYTTIVPITVSAFDPTVALVDFEYTVNNDGTYTITSWKGTLNGEVSTELIIPNNNLIVV